VSWFAPKELLATIGLDRLAALCGVYVCSLAPALLLGSSKLSEAVVVALVLWTTAAVIIALAAGYCFSRFRSDAREILMPCYQHVLRRSVVWLLSLTLALPSLLFWILVPSTHFGPWLILAAPLAFLLPMWLRPMRLGGRLRQSHKASVSRYSARLPSQAIGMFIGRPYAPLPSASWTLGLVALVSLLWIAPLVLMLTSASEPWSDFAPLYLALTAIAGWGWFMIDLARFARNRTGSFAELALLPGLGNALSQRRALYRAALVRPLLLLFCCLAAGMLMAWSAWHTPARIVRFGVGCAVLLLFCAASVLQLLNAKTTTPTRVAVLSQSIVPMILAPTLLQTLPSEAWFSHPGAQRLFLIFMLILTAVPVYTIWIYSRGLARRPHPFLETSS
jgi:hypothetical protein